MQGSISVQGVSRAYRRYHADRPWTLQEALTRGLRGLRAAEVFWALRDVTFTIAPGRMAGVVGPNGAGKSTLLRLVGGVGRPDTGRIQVNGRMGALLDLGAGFHAELTGRENVYISGVISGLTRSEIRRQFDSIIDFAELAAFVDSPLRTYSSGMIMRLAFAVAAHIEPEILLIDEVLSVGDLAFQEKCLRRIADFKAQGCTILLVSHNINEVERLCDEVIWLRTGHLVAHGPTAEVTAEYIEQMTHLADPS